MDNNDGNRAAAAAAAAAADAVVLVVGACALDRLLLVPTYPSADAKVRSSSYHEVGGGNAANTASACALLTTASFLDRKVAVRLCSKVGSDHVGNQVREELERAGVDLASSTATLFRVGGEGTTTSFTTVIVSESEHTRTCIHTPGTCGELTVADVDSRNNMNMDKVFENVVHLHSDSRHTDVSLLLAREAKRRGIPVSVDVERDRKTQAFDELVREATMVFTNSDQIHGYVTEKLAAIGQREGDGGYPTHEAVVEHSSDDGMMSDGDAQMYARSILPITYLTQRYRRDTGHREVVITKGNRGALHVACNSGNCLVEDNEYDGPDVNKIIVSSASTSPGLVRIQHQFTERTDKTSHSSSSKRLYSAELSIRQVGVLSGVKVVDTTGAGDAFIGGYIVASRVKNSSNTSSSFDVESCLRFGCWVAGRKLEGVGARTSLPTGDKDVDEALGKDIDKVQETLRKIIGPFQRE